MSKKENDKDNFNSFMKELNEMGVHKKKLVHGSRITLTTEKNISPNKIIETLEKAAEGKEIKAGYYTIGYKTKSDQPELKYTGSKKEGYLDRADLMRQLYDAIEDMYDIDVGDSEYQGETFSFSMSVLI